MHQSGGGSSVPWRNQFEQVEAGGVDLFPGALRTAWFLPWHQSCTRPLVLHSLQGSVCAVRDIVRPIGDCSHEVRRHVVGGDSQVFGREVQRRSGEVGRFGRLLDTGETPGSLGSGGIEALDRLGVGAFIAPAASFRACSSRPFPDITSTAA